MRQTYQLLHKKLNQNFKGKRDVNRETAALEDSKRELAGICLKRQYTGDSRNYVLFSKKGEIKTFNYNIKARSKEA